MATLARSTTLGERELAEIRRSAEEARSFFLASVTRSQVERYLNPPSNTPYGLEYAFHLLGDIRGKTILDLGCGKGENLIPLAERGGNVIGIDISPELVHLAEARIRSAGVKADLAVGSAYETGLPDESVDIIFLHCTYSPLRYSTGTGRDAANCEERRLRVAIGTDTVFEVMRPVQETAAASSEHL